MFDVRSWISKASSLLLAQMFLFNGLKELIQFPPQDFQLPMQLMVERFVGQRTGLEQGLQMIDGLNARCQSIRKLANEFPFVLSPSVPLDYA